MPGGVGEPVEIGRLLIANVGGTNTHGDYKTKLARRGQEDDTKIWRKPQREGIVLNHARLSLSVWVLVAKALHSLGFKVKDG